ncbi:MFS transporter, partial [Ascoidea rubescens DSM 1968]
GQNEYTLTNAVGYFLSCFFSISFIVFLTSTQPFFLTDILGISNKIGNYIGTLTFADEILSIITSPLFGALSDKIGTRPITVFGLIIIGASFLTYTLAKNVYPDMLFLRLFFALGATACGSMITAMLTELTCSNFQLNNDNDEEEDIIINENDNYSINTSSSNITGNNDKDSNKRNGKLTSYVGIATGFGAIFSVVFFLTLPVKFGKHYPTGLALKYSYLTVGLIAIFVGIFLSFLLYKDNKKVGVNKKILQVLGNLNYFELLKMGFKAAKERKIALGYFGSFISRSSSIIIGSFLPLYVNDYFQREYDRNCSSISASTISIAGGNGDDNDYCRKAYVYSSMLIGISQLISLIVAPLFGILCDKFGRKNVMLVSSLFGFLGNFSISFIRKVEKNLVFLMVLVSFIGISHIGNIIGSMSLCTDKQRTFSGAISGVYTFCGGIGILIISKLGGYLSDHWIGSSFLILSVFNLLMVVLILI